MEKAFTDELLLDENEERIKQMYAKAVMEPNSVYVKKGFIKCPECGEEILMLPSLRKMNEAIENHVKLHKELLKNSPLISNIKSMNIRLDLAQQVLLQASDSV
jgi:hypothetical protein